MQFNCEEEIYINNNIYIYFNLSMEMFRKNIREEDPITCFTMENTITPPNNHKYSHQVKVVSYEKMQHII